MGNELTRLFGAEFMRVPLSCRVGLGLSVLTFILILCGVFHVFTPPVLFGVWLLWLAASVPGFLQVRKESFFTEAFPDGDPSWNPLFLRIGIAVMLAICLLHAMTPETRHDPYDYHLTIPTLYLASGKIVEIPWHVFTYMPKNNEILYGMALGVGNDSLSKAIHFMFGGLCILSIASFIKRIAGHEASMLAGLLIVTLPLFGFLSTSSYIDLGRAFWELSALYMLSQVWDESDLRTRRFSLVLSGWMAGMALGSKYVAFLVFFIPYLLLAFLTFWKRLRPTGLRLPAFWIASIGIPVAPWLVYNFLWTGNPLYPLLPSIFGLHIPPAAAAYDFIRSHAPQAANLMLSALPGYFLKRINGLLLDGNALVLIGVVAWASVRWWRNQSVGLSLASSTVRGLLIFTLVSSILFVVGCDNMDGRFFFSTLSLLAIPVTFFLFALSHSIRQTTPWGRYVIPGFALVLFANAVTYRFNQMNDLQESPLPILSDAQRDRWLRNRFQHYRAAEWANENLPRNAVVLGMGYPLRLPYIAKIKYGYIPFLADLPPNAAPEELAETLTDNHVRYIVKPFIETDPPQDFSRLEPRYMQSIFSHRNIEIYELTAE